MTVPSEPPGTPMAPVLRTGVVVLRALAEHDVPALVEQERDALVRRWSPTAGTVDVTAADRLVQTTRQQWASRSPTAPRRWAVAAGEDEDVYAAYAGQVEYLPDGRGTAEVGFVLHPGCRGQGLATRALGLAVRYAHEVDGVHTLHWRCEVGNWRSRRVVWRVGFRVEGTIRGVVPGPDHPRLGWWGTRQAGDPVAPVHPWWEVPELTFGPVVLRPADDALEEPASARGASWVVASAAGAWAGGRLTVRCPVDAPGSDGGRLDFSWPAAGHQDLADALALVAGYAFAPASATSPGRLTEGGLGLHRLVTTVPVDDVTARQALHATGWRAVGREHAAGRHPGTGAVLDVVRFERLATDR
jgi:RimJ/RimL family protein N-acetyltransferase